MAFNFSTLGVSIRRLIILNFDKLVTTIVNTLNRHTQPLTISHTITFLTEGVAVNQTLIMVTPLKAKKQKILSKMMTLNIPFLLQRMYHLRMRMLIMSHYKMRKRIYE